MKEVERIAVPPRKKVLRDKADFIAEKICVSELVDNCIDHWTRIGKNKDLEVRIRVIREATAVGCIKPITKFEMKWNMSLPYDKIADVLTLGAHADDAGEVIGLWGQGAKIAMHGIARGWTLTTNDTVRTYSVECPADWIFEENNWDLIIEKDKRLPDAKEETIFASMLLHEKKWKEAKKDEEFYDPHNPDIDTIIRGHLESRYSQYGEIKPRLKLFYNDVEIELIDVQTMSRIKRDYLWLPGFQPHVLKGTITRPTRDPSVFRDLKVSIFVGLHRNPSREDAGVYLFGNGRMFLKASKEAPLYKSYSPKDVRIRVFVFLEGSSQDIPWGIPEKDGLNQEHPVVPELARLIKRSVEAYGQIVTMKTEHLDLYCLEDDIQSLIVKIEPEKKRAEALFQLFEKLRQFNETELRFYYGSFVGGRPILRCMEKQFRDEVSRRMEQAKTNRGWLEFHFWLSEHGTIDPIFKADIGEIRSRLFPPAAVTPPIQKVTEPPTTPSRTSISSPGVTQLLTPTSPPMVLTKKPEVSVPPAPHMPQAPMSLNQQAAPPAPPAAVSSPAQPPRRTFPAHEGVGQNANNPIPVNPPLPKKYSKETLARFDESLRTLGVTIKIIDEDEVMDRVIKAMRKISKELASAKYDTKERIIYRDLLGLKSKGNE
jgi:hypothetical protein